MIAEGFLSLSIVCTMIDEDAISVASFVKVMILDMYKPFSSVLLSSVQTELMIQIEFYKDSIMSIDCND